MHTSKPPIVFRAVLPFFSGYCPEGKQKGRYSPEELGLGGENGGKYYIGGKGGIFPFVFCIFSSKEMYFRLSFR